MGFFRKLFSKEEEVESRTSPKAYPSKKSNSNTRRSSSYYGRHIDDSPTGSFSGYSDGGSDSSIDYGSSGSSSSFDSGSSSSSSSGGDSGGSSGGGD